MKDTLTSNNHQDFRARYSGTFGWYLQDSGKRKLVQISEVTRHAAHFADGGDFDFHINVDSGVQFEFIPVDKGWFNGKNGEVYFLCRHPARQWKRGIHIDNTMVYKITSMSLNQGVSYDILANIFIDGFDNWQIKEPPCALSKHFAIDKNNQLWFFDKVVGIVDKDIIKLNNPIVLQELTDIVKRRNYNYKVVING